MSARVSPGRRHGALAAATLAALLLAACGNSTSDADPAAGATLTVEARDIEFDRDAYRITAGPVDIVYQQQGTLPHSLVIEDAYGTAIDGFKLEVGDSDADRGTVDLPPGDYVIYCDVPGHRGAGMEAELQVD